MTTFRNLFGTALLCLGAVSAAHASPIRYDFSLDWSSGPLAGTTSFGSLAFDSSLAIANAEYTQPDLLQSFSAVVGGKSYGLDDVGLGYLQFDANAQLRLLNVGTDCGPGYCASPSNNPDALYFVYDSQSQVDRFFGVAGPAVEGLQSTGAGTLAVTPVPEPETWALLGVGLLAIMARRRARPATVAWMAA